MVAPTDTIDAVARAVAESGELPSETSVLTHEADMENDDADVDLPLLQLEVDTSNQVQIHNDDIVGWITDGDGNRVGRIYESEYELSIQISIWTVGDGGYDPDEMGKALRNALYPYTTAGPSEPLCYSNSTPIDEIFYVDIGDGMRDDSLIETPTVRRWRQDVEVWATEEFRTTEDYIVDVVSPQPGTLDDSDADGVIEG